MVLHAEVSDQPGLVQGQLAQVYGDVRNEEKIDLPLAARVDQAAELIKSLGTGSLGM